MRIGVAGYMGAGKSTVARALAGECRCDIIDADAEAKRCMEQSPEIRDELTRQFGEQVITGKGIDYSALGRIVFGNRERLMTLNRIVHPPLLRRLYRQIYSQDRDSVLDAALISLWSIESWFDLLVWVQAPFATRRDRIRRATGQPLEAVEERLRMQESLFSEPSAPPWCILDNSGPMQRLQAAVKALPVRGAG